MLGDLVDEVLSRQRVETDDLAGWVVKEAPSRRLIQATGRVVDITHRPSTTVVWDRYAPLAEEELARPWLRHIHELQRPKSGMASRRIPFQREALSFLDLQPPLYFDHEAEGEWAYVDIRRAYQSIYTPLTLDMRFRPDPELPRIMTGRYDFLGIDELASIKPLHLAVGGIIVSQRLNVTERGREVSYDTRGWGRPGNPNFLAPDLWGVICYTLHAVANVAQHEFGAVYWNKDGGIVPLGNVKRLTEHLKVDWFLDSKVRAAGKGWVHGPTSWQVGDRGTKGKVRRGRPIHRVLDVSPAVVRALQRLRR